MAWGACASVPRSQASTHTVQRQLHHTQRPAVPTPAAFSKANEAQTDAMAAACGDTLPGVTGGGQKEGCATGGEACPALRCRPRRFSPKQKHTHDRHRLVRLQDALLPLLCTSDTGCLLLVAWDQPDGLRPAGRPRRLAATPSPAFWKARALVCAPACQLQEARHAAVPASVWESKLPGFSNEAPVSFLNALLQVTEFSITKKFSDVVS